LEISPALRSEPGGLYHLTGDGSTSWHGFAEFIFRENAKRGGPAPAVEAIPSADYKTAAARPLARLVAPWDQEGRSTWTPVGWKSQIFELLQSQGKPRIPYVLQARPRHLKRSPEGSAFPIGNILNLGFGPEIEFSRSGHFH